LLNELSMDIFWEESIHNLHHNQERISCYNGSRPLFGQLNVGISSLTESRVVLKKKGLFGILQLKASTRNESRTKLTMTKMLFAPGLFLVAFVLATRKSFHLFTFSVYIMARTHFGNFIRYYLFAPLSGELGALVLEDVNGVPNLGMTSSVLTPSLEFKLCPVSHFVLDHSSFFAVIKSNLET